MFYLDKTAIEIAKLADKPLNIPSEADEKSSQISAFVWITPKGLLHYTNGYFQITYRLPNNLLDDEDSAQAVLFSQDPVHSESHLKEPVALVGKELAHMCDFKSEMVNVGEYATIVDSVKGGHVDIFLTTGIAETKSRHKIVNITMPQFEVVENKVFANGSKGLVSYEYLHKLTTIAKKVCKQVDESSVMITIDQAHDRVQLTADRLCITLATIKTDDGAPMPTSFGKEFGLPDPVEPATEEPEKTVENDEKYSEAVDLVIEENKASASFLQRRLGIGYARAAGLLDRMEKDGIVGAAMGAKGREIYGLPK